MSSWHNKFGENGQRLTILSLLSPTPDGLGALQHDGEISLREAIDEIFRLGGQDGEARLVLEVTGQNGDGPDFSVQENVSLRELADRLYGSYGADGDRASVLRLVQPGDELLGEWASSGDDDPNGLSPLRRFREAIHRLFGGSAEQGVPPTVVGLLVGPTLGSKTDDA
jgi:hypothetical protein